MKARAVFLSFAILICASAFAFAQGTQYRPPGLRHPAGERDGKVLYLSDCAWCHGAAGEGTDRAPAINAGSNGPAMNHFMLSSGRMPLTDPHQPARRRPSAYTPAQIRAIVRFAESFGAPGPDIPDPEPDRGDLHLGQQLYQENCAACHSTTGIGGALSSSNRAVAGAKNEQAGVAPALAVATPQEVAEAMLVGPGAMPVFGPGTFSRKQADSIVRYVEYLQAPKNAGGLPMGKIGPWSEGAAGWILGLGSLVLLIRWLGSKDGESPGHESTGDEPTGHEATGHEPTGHEATGHEPTRHEPTRNE